MQRVDDSDLSRLLYAFGAHGWKKMTGDLNESNQTSHGSPEIGASVTLRYNGTSVQVLGTIRNGTTTQTPIATFTLDNVPQTPFKAPKSNETEYTRSFYNSGFLPPGEHTLLVTLIDPDNKLWLDYFEYFSADIAASGTPTISIVSSAIGTNTPNAQPETSQSLNTASKGLIAGICVLAVFLVSLCAVVGFLWYRRRKRKTWADPDPNLAGEDSRGPPRLTSFANLMSSRYHMEQSPVSRVSGAGGSSSFTSPATISAITEMTTGTGTASFRNPDSALGQAPPIQVSGDIRGQSDTTILAPRRSEPPSYFSLEARNGGDGQ
ncbi:hypothetical protein L218DRAFT_1074525 [Marasmius fiardii PR-910]|nr:hypothetical protein L218DRAFT_1074525 [Marasmius fiardii PR-910]